MIVTGEFKFDDDEIRGYIKDRVDRHLSNALEMLEDAELMALERVWHAVKDFREEPEEAAVEAEEAVDPEVESGSKMPPGQWGRLMDAWYSIEGPADTGDIVEQVLGKRQLFTECTEEEGQRLMAVITSIKKGHERGYAEGRAAGYNFGNHDGYQKGWRDCLKQDTANEVDPKVAERLRPRLTKFL